MRQPGRANSRTLTRRKEPPSHVVGIGTSASSRKSILVKRCGRWNITYTFKNAPSSEDALEDTTGTHPHAVVCRGRTSASVRVSGKRRNDPFPHYRSSQQSAGTTLLIKNPPMIGSPPTDVTSTPGPRQHLQMYVSRGTFAQAQ